MAQQVPENRENVRERGFSPILALWRWSGIEGKSGWDWAELFAKLSLPVLLFLGSQYISQENARAQKESAASTQQDLVVAKYIDSMKALVLDHGLGKGNPGSRESVIARTLTLTSLSQLGGTGASPNRKASILQFLYESGLLKYDSTQERFDHRSIVNPKNADFSGIKLKGAELRWANFTYINFSGADLRWAFLQHSTLHGADLRGADLREAALSGTDLQTADLRGADLRGARLNKAQLWSVKWDKNTKWPGRANFKGAEAVPPELWQELSP